MRSAALMAKRSVTKFILENSTTALEVKSALQRNSFVRFVWIFLAATTLFRMTADVSADFFCKNFSGSTGGTLTCKSILSYSGPETLSL